MISRIFHWITGYACFEVQGQTSRFLNLAAKSRLTIWHLTRDGEKAVGNIRAREYKELRPISRRCGAKLRCRHKGGLPFYTERLWRRKGLLLGAAAGIALYFFLSSFIWEVQINGLQNLTPVEVETAARSCGVYEGARKDSFSPAGAAHEMMSLVPQLGWVSVNTDGCMVQIEIKEAEEKPEMAETEGPTNIVAAREGKIVGIEAEAGMKRVNIGDVVQKGQLLITGVYDENVSPYTVKKAPIKSFALQARGSVTAETVRTYEVKSDAFRETENILEEKTTRYLLFFGLKIPLGFHAADDGMFRLFPQTEWLQLLGQELPVGIRREKRVYTEIERTPLNEQERKENALFKLRQMQKKELGESTVLLEEELTYQSTPEGIALQAICRFEEEIGVQQDALWNITE